MTSQIHNRHAQIYHVTFPAISPSRNDTQVHLMASESVMGLEPDVFYQLFPFHFIMDSQLGIIQVGSAIKKIIPRMAQPGARVDQFLKARIDGCVILFYPPPCPPKTVLPITVLP